MALGKTIQDRNIHHVSKKLCIFICQNFVKFPPILIIFGVWVVKCLKFYAVYALPPNLTHVTALPLNADVPHFYLTPDLLQLNCSDLVINSIECASYMQFIKFVIRNSLSSE